MPAISGPETFNSQFVVAANGQVSLATPPFSTAGGTINGQVVIRAPASSAPVLTVSSNTSTVLPTPQPNTLIQFANADAGAARVLIDGYNGDPTLTFRRSGGTAIAQTPVVAGNNIGFINALGYGTNAYGTGRTYIQMTAAEAWTNTAQGAYLAFGTTPIGTVTTAEAMRIDNTGFVGIGTMAPPVKLTVSSNAAPPQPGIIANMAVVGADNTIARVIIDAYGTGFAHLNFRAAAGTAAAPSAVISGQEIGRINATGYFVGTYSGPRTSIISYAMETWAVGAQGAALAFNTTPIGTQVTAEAMRIADNGNVGIGTTAPGNKLAVVGQLAAGGSPVIQVRTGPNGADSTSVMMQFADFASAAQIGAIARTGTNTVVYSTTSDERLKEDISDSQLGIEELMQVKVRDFTWKADGSHAHGLVAQEVAKVYPQAVHEGGKDPNLEPWMIDYGRLTPLLIKGMQQQQEMIAALQAKVAALESATVH